MARTQSRTKTDIWNNEEFRALSCNAQRLYWLLYSQPTISLCGVLALTAGRWCRMAQDDSREDVDAGLTELEAARFVIIDYQTEEVFVRSFMRNDGVWNSPKTQSAARDRVSAVMSSPLRRAIAVEMGRLDGGDEKDQADTPPDTPPDTPSDAVSPDENETQNGVAHTLRVHACADSSLQSPVSSLQKTVSVDDRSSPLQGDLISIRDSIASHGPWEARR